MTNIAELEGGGHPASLGVYHELHCVVRGVVTNTLKGEC